MNRISLVGRITKEPKKSDSGKYVDFTIAVSRSYAKEGEQNADFFSVRALGEKRADFVCKYFPTGEPIAVSGEMHADQYEKDGQKQTFHRVLAEQVYFVPQSKKEKSDAPSGFTELEQDEMPF